MKKHLALFALLAACGTDSPGVALLPGFDPPDPGPDGIQFVIPIVHGIPPGTDETLCTYLDYDVSKDLDITAYEGFSSAVGSHHEILYTVVNKRTADTHPCDETDMLNARYLGGGGAESPAVPLPDGIVMRIPAHSQIMIQHHWINATDAAIDGQVAFNVTVEAASASNMVAELFTDVTTQITLAPGTGSAHAQCTVGQDLQLFMIGGHAHELGTHVAIATTTAAAAGAANVIYDTDWNASYQFNPPRNNYSLAQPLVLHKGDQIAVQCDYNNTTGATVMFPREMCVAWGYFFPATLEIDCVDGAWPHQ
jgi:hypothetical protein